jgi:hypothetical protein
MKRLLLLIISLVLIATRGLCQNYSLTDCQQLFESGDKDEALPYLITMLELEKSKPDFDEDTVGTIFMLLTNIYSSHGQLKEVLDLCQTVGELFNEKSPYANTELSRMLWRIRGTVSMELKDFDDALQYLQQAQWMYEDESLYDRSYFGILTYIGGCYISKKDFANAKLYLDEALEIHNTYLGAIEESTYPDSFQLLNYLGLFNQQIGNVELAEKYYRDILNAIHEDIVLSEIKYLASINLGNLYILTGRYKEAETLYDSVSLNSPALLYNLYQNRAFGELIQGNNDSALTYLNESNKQGLKYLESIIFNFAEVEREHLWSEMADQLSKNNSFFGFWTGIDSANITAFEYNNFTRDFNGSIQPLIKTILFSKNDASNQLLWDDYQNNRGLLSYGFSTKEEHDSIARQVIEQERMLLSKVNFDLFKFFKDNYDVSVLSRGLSEDEIIFDCISMSYMKGKSFEDGFDQGFSVYTLTHESDTPLLFPVCKQLDLYSYVRNENWDEEKINELYTEHNDTLFQLIVKPLIPHLNGKKTIYFRPISLLSLINIGAIRMPNGKRFDEEFNLKIVSSFSSLKDRYKFSSTNSLALFGDAQYDEINNLYENSDNLAFAPTNEFAVITRGDRGKWGPLPGTRIEVQHIDSIAGVNAIPSTTYLGTTSTESSFKSLSKNSPSIIHIATHGYFIADNEAALNNNFLQKTTGYSWGNHLMLYSGLLFSGANAVWNGNSRPNPIDDGIVTADEISRLDLSNTGLVVLSACDSGRGHFNGTEGIMGLQRAFKLAGAKTMIMSLWKVPDIPTSILMDYFYQNLFKGMEVRPSLIEAQKQLQKEGYTDPFYWASFIVID